MSNHPIIALWVHPRSMSTAMERIMRERGDLQCLHEPFMYYYYVGLEKKTLPLSDLHIGNPVKFDEIIAMFKEKSSAGPVFFKDMGYYVLPEIYQHPDIANDFKHLIQIRDPRKSILSYYKLDNQVSNEEIGVEAQWQLYCWLKANGESAPYVVEAETVQLDARAELTRVWQYLDLPIKDHAFQWNNEAVPEDWQSVSGWHGDVIASSGINSLPQESDKEIQQRFDDAAAKSPQLKAFLDHHWPFYLKLKEASADNP